METVYFNSDSDIARMVLGYLREQCLDKAAEMFCKTSPFLQKEDECLKQGYRSFIKDDKLDKIIKEYCKIATKVDKEVKTIPLSIQETLKNKKLSSKVSSLIHYTSSAIVIENKESSVKSNKRKRMSIDSTDCEIQSTRNDDMCPPKSVIKRMRTSRGNNYVGESKESTLKDYEILSQSEVCGFDSDDDEPDLLDPTTQSTSTPRAENPKEELLIPSIPDISLA